MTSAFPYYVNMLPKDWTRSRESARVARRWGMGVLGMLVGVGLPGLMLGMHLRVSPLPARGSLGQLQNEIETIQAELPVIRARVNGLVARERELALRETRVEWLPVLDRIGPLLPEGTRLVSFTGEIYTAELVIELLIENESASEARTALVTLEGAGVFDQVEMIESVSVRRDSGERVRSTVRLGITAGAEGGTP